MTQNPAEQCLSCLGLSGERRISPGTPIHIGEYWQVEHAYPSGLLGWLVIALRRHAIALHELRPEEYVELGVLMERTVRLLRAATGCHKEYVACYAESPGFEHLHFHVVPRAEHLAEDLRGAGSFAFLRVSEAEAVDRAAVIRFCESLRSEFG
jgi:diadenosine tetraphosphate (Ap4A) HIT family hydrolase